MVGMKDVRWEGELVSGAVCDGREWREHKYVVCCLLFALQHFNPLGATHCTCDWVIEKKKSLLIDRSDDLNHRPSRRTMSISNVMKIVMYKPADC